MEKKKSIRARAPKASSKKIRYIMKQIQRQDTHPEMMLRSQLHRNGLRFRKDNRPEKDLKIKVDILFPKEKVCIFIDGCFWHGCPIHFKPPKTNTEWWKEKIDDNSKRDQRQNGQLFSRGWLVLRFWEHEIDSELDKITKKIIRQIIKRKER